MELAPPLLKLLNNINHLFTCSWGIPSSWFSFLLTARFTPMWSVSSNSSAQWSGWLQHVFVQQLGNVIFASDLFCNSSSLLLLNRKTLKALCSIPASMFTFRWHVLLVSLPTTASFSSTKIQRSSKYFSCVASMFVSVVLSTLQRSKHEVTLTKRLNIIIILMDLTPARRARVHCNDVG